MKVPTRFAGRLVEAGLLFALFPSSALGQCSLCRDAVAASSPETREAMNYAIIGLAFAPYVVGTLAAWILSPALRARVRGWLARSRPHGVGNSL